ncbi:kinesin family member 22 [Nematocida sp. AWRm77]|nr:kinesin family member 22 [Nematocida sp. AWRm77]
MSSGIRSVLRIRPPHKSTGSEEVKIAGKTIVVGKNQNEEVVYGFDACYRGQSTQEDMFKEVEPCLDNIARGINTTVMAYGATGSGKTHTMLGSASAPGIIPRLVDSLFGKYAETFSILFEISISVSYMEIYNEKVYDLLSSEQKPEAIPVRENSLGQVVLQGLREEKVASFKEFTELFSRGVGRRKTAATLLNSESSRSHALLSLMVELSTQTAKIRTKINLVDLAGSECNRRTGNKDERLVESANINRSLFVLNKVVDALGQKCVHIPYRDSKLTRLLQDSLGGSSDCVLIVNIVGECTGDTLSTLAFAGKSRKVQMKTQEEKMKANGWKEREKVAPVCFNAKPAKKGHVQSEALRSGPFSLVRSTLHTAKMTSSNNNNSTSSSTRMGSTRMGTRMGSTRMGTRMGSRTGVKSYHGQEQEGKENMLQARRSRVDSTDEGTSARMRSVSVSPYRMHRAHRSTSKEVSSTSKGTAKRSTRPDRRDGDGDRDGDGHTAAKVERKSNVQKSVSRSSSIQVQHAGASLAKEVLSLETRALLNSQDFLQLKSIPLIGDRRAAKILNYSKIHVIRSVQDLLAAGISQKVIHSIISTEKEAGKDQRW